MQEEKKIDAISQERQTHAHIVQKICTFMMTTNNVCQKQILAYKKEAMLMLVKQEIDVTC